jgi:hypothetical protein
MGIKRGITLIAGGGFHGKSTLLQALEAGVYNKVKLDQVQGLRFKPEPVCTYHAGGKPSSICAECASACGINACSLTEGLLAWASSEASLSSLEAAFMGKARCCRH